MIIPTIMWASENQALTKKDKNIECYIFYCVLIVLSVTFGQYPYLLQEKTERIRPEIDKNNIECYKQKQLGSDLWLMS